jgi:sporulation protein YlmC with PRC-barrel domain
MSGTATNETGDLIASDKVEGTAVYDRNGTKLGSVYNFMVEKRSGTSPTRFCPSAASSVWEAAIIRCRGISLPMSRRRAAT